MSILKQIEQNVCTNEISVEYGGAVDPEFGAIKSSELDAADCQVFLAVELCCGTAGLSRALIEAGIPAVGIDHVHNKSKPKAPVVIADLSTIEGQSLALQLFEKHKPYVIHSGPPCGTSSRARERPISNNLKLRGAPEPKPLRSDSHPWGIPGLVGTDLERVNAANMIYKFILGLCKKRHAAGELFSLENPSTSIFWMIPEAIELQQLPDVFVVDFQQCCHGGFRPVWRRWLTNAEELTVLSARCPGESANHKHLGFQIRKEKGSWRFDTADEAAYPEKLCHSYATIIRQRFFLHLSSESNGFPTNTPEAITVPLDEEQHKAKKAKLRASLGLFVRGNRFPSLIPEFSERIWMTLEGNAGDVITLDDKHKGRILKGNGVKSARHGNSCVQESVDSKEKCVGIYRSPCEFIEQAKLLQHPIDMPSFLPEALLRSIFLLLTSTPQQISSIRLEKLKQIRQWAIELQDTNAEIFRSIKPEQRIVSRGKNFALMDRILNHIEYPDTNLVRDLASGTKFTGDIPESGVFPRRHRGADLSVDEVLKTASYSRKWVIEHTVSSGDDEIDQAVWDETIEEEKRGWLSPALDEADLLTLTGNKFVVARRFGIRQGKKIRNIDDYSISGANSAVSTFEKLDLLGTDELFAVLKTIVQAGRSDGVVEITLPSGEKLTGSLPPGATTTMTRKWIGKTFDLKSAYRQIAVSMDESNLPFSIISVYNPAKKQAELRRQYATPYGSVASVYLFNRLARAIWAIGTWLHIAWVNFFDDFPTVEPEASAHSAELTVRAMCVLLGWELQLDPAKNKPFADTFPMLGIVVSMEDLPKGIARAANKEGRIDDIVSIIDRILETDLCPKPLVDELRGKCQFAMAQMSGRIAAGPVSGLAEHQYRTKGDRISKHTRETLEMLKRTVSLAGPRELHCLNTDKPICVFTDGACEGDLVTMGAVIIDSAGQFEPFMWGTPVPHEMVRRWRKDGSLQVIGQTEILPIVVCKWAYRRLFHNRRILFFVDNDSARHAMTAGYSASYESNRLIQVANRCEAEFQTLCWYTRVPSASNPADGPSRLDLTPSESNAWAKVVDPPALPESLFEGT